MKNILGDWLKFRHLVVHPDTIVDGTVDAATCRWALRSGEGWRPHELTLQMPCSQIDTRRNLRVWVEYDD